MMDDSFSFEPVKLNAGSDPTKVRCNDALCAGVDRLTNSHHLPSMSSFQAGTKEEEDEGVLGKRHRNSNGDAAQVEIPPPPI